MMGDGSDLIAQVIDAHGGMEPVRAARELVVEYDAGGFLFASRFTRTDYRGSQGRISLDRQRTEFPDYPKNGFRGIFDRGNVRIEGDRGALVARRDNPRPQFLTLRRRLHWDALDVLYFAGYAMWTYLATPFVFSDDRFQFVTTELSPWHERNGQVWRRLAVTFPPDLHAHCAQQVFYFDQDGLLMRNDYTAEVVGGWAKAVHYCSDYRRFGELYLPSRRRVYPRLPGGRPLNLPLMVWIDIRDVKAV